MSRLPVPAEVYALVEQTPATALLEGRKQNYSEGNNETWTRLFISPVRVCAPWQAAEIPALFAEIESAVAQGLSAAGFFSYECGNCFEPKAAMRKSLDGQPLAWFGIYERSYVFDHNSGTFVDGEPSELKTFRDDLKPASLHDSSSRTTSSRSGLAKGHDFSRAEAAEKREGALAPEEIAAEFALTEAEYAQRIAAIHELIRAGDVYQLNFTAPFRFKVQAGMASLYARLRARQPVDYGAFLHWEQDRFIQSFSPELFFRIENDGGKIAPARHIVTRPMKGTAPRGHTTREDREIAEWLRNDPKNRSENVMIVDLLRNDLGRVAQTGSVRAERLFDVERYSTLWQMTSTVSADLRPDVGFHEIFRALFPSGSVTGAPKVRAMQLLADLEDGPRGVYTGAIGFFSPRETVFNVAIRTIEFEGGRGNGTRGTMGAGSGIVIDSDPAAEYRECLLKAEFLTQSSSRRPEHFSLIETLLWDGAYPFLELHLDRLADSADYFDFASNRDAVREALAHHAGHFAGQPEQSPRWVRLLLESDGRFEVTNEILRSHGDRIARVRISPQRTDPADPMLYHKTTHRPLYTQALAEAVRDNFDDVIFLNPRGEVTEGAISNIFIEKDGKWSTPPIECGLLAGVFRRHLLATRPEIEERGLQRQVFVAGVQERVLHINDLRQADAVYLANAVRGLRRAIIVW